MNDSGQRGGTAPDVARDAAAQPDTAAGDSVTHRQLFAYLNAEHADSYIAIMRLFTSTLLADLSAAEVAEHLAAAGVDLDGDAAEGRCQQLVDWGNLVRSVRDTRVPTIAAYHRSRARYQVSKLGGRVHRAAEEVLSASENAREVARELLAKIVDTLEQIAFDIASPGTVDSERLAGNVTSVFVNHRTFTDSVTEFYAYLAGVLTRYDLAGEEYRQFKDLLVDYVDLIGADVNRNSPRILDRLGKLTPLLDDVLAALPDVPALAGPAGVERQPGRARTDWDQLAAWYGADSGRSGPDQLRAAARQALNQLITNARRMLAASGTGVTRRADFLKLATWFHTADSDTAARLFDAAYGTYPARHLLLGPDEPDPRIRPDHSWWDSDPVDVPMAMREHGDRNARGRNSRVPDTAADGRRLIAAAQARLAARRAAAQELAAAGRALDGAQLSPAARDLLLDQLAGAITGAALTPGEPVARHDSDLEIAITVERRPGQHTRIRSDDGNLTVEDFVVTARSTAEPVASDGSREDNRAAAGERA